MTKILIGLFALLIVCTISTPASNSDSLRTSMTPTPADSFEQLVSGLENQEVKLLYRVGGSTIGTLSKGASDHLVITYSTKTVDYVPYSSVSLVRKIPGTRPEIYLK